MVSFFLCSFGLVDEESWALQLCNSHWKCACKGTSGCIPDNLVVSLKVVVI